MGITDGQLRSFIKSFMGFGDHHVMLKEVTKLSLTLEAKPQTTIAMVEFVVIDAFSPYNALLGHCHNGFSLDLDDHKNKWSRHRSFLYGCDQSPEMHVLKLGTEIPNLKQHNWSTELIWKF